MCFQNSVTVMQSYRRCLCMFSGSKQEVSDVSIKVVPVLFKIQRNVHFDVKQQCGRSAVLGYEGHEI